MCPLQFIVLCELLFLTSGGKCLRDGWVKERCLNWWCGPLELVRANDAEMFLMDQIGFQGREHLCGIMKLVHENCLGV